MTNLLILDIIKGFGLQFQPWVLPIWDDTDGRPEDASGGVLGYNRDTKTLELFDGTMWVEVVTAS